MHKNHSFPLDFQFNVELLLADLAICQQKEWMLHFNQKDYSGEWASIALQSKSGKATDIYAISGTENTYKPTELLAECPYFQFVINQFKAPLESIRLLNLMPNSEIKTHRDQGCCYEDGVFRLHIPITTDEKVDFIVEGEKLQMQAGSCWYANFDLPHSVVHNGTKPRIHLIIDGLRNEWSDEIFRQAGYDFEAEKLRNEPDLETKKQMIEMLKLMNTDAARELVEKLTSEIAKA
jgi:hypothetical protein